MEEEKLTQLLVSLFKELNHALRTPLSVINNEVQYLQKTSPQVDIDPIQNGVKATLHHLDTLSSLSEIKGSESLNELIEGLPPEWFSSSLTIQLCSALIGSKVKGKRVKVKETGTQSFLITFQNLEGEEFTLSKLEKSLLRIILEFEGLQLEITDSGLILSKQ